MTMIVVNGAKTLKVAQKAPDARALEIISKIRSNPLYDTAWGVAEMLSDTYDIPVHIAFRNRQGSYAQKLGKLRYQIIFGYDCIDYFAKNGFTEYKSLAFMVRREKNGDLPTGNKAAEWVAAHEFAHVVAYFRNEENPYPIRPHGNEFYKAYREVIDLVF